MSHVYDRVGAGYETSPAILDALVALLASIGLAERQLIVAREAQAADGGGRSGVSGVGYGLARAHAGVRSEIDRQREYLASGEPERLAGL